MGQHAGDLNAKLQLLIDKDEIRDLIYSYCQTVDRLDYDRLRRLYHEDATDNHGYNPSSSVDEFIEMLKPHSESSSGIHHAVCNSYIKVDGDYAEAETYLLASQYQPDGEGRAHMSCGGRYLDKFTRVDNVWKFQTRCLVVDFARRVQATDAFDNQHIKNVVKGSTGPNDVSYGFFKFFKWGQR
jgi:hypothetical protein